MAKLKQKDLAEHLKKVYETYKVENAIDKIDKNVLTLHYLENGQITKQYHCMNCGENYTFRTHSRNLYTYQSPPCPRCGNQRIRNGSFQNEKCNISITKDSTFEKDGIVFVLYKIQASFNISNSPYKWIYEDPEPQIEISAIGYFDSTNGVHLLNIKSVEQRGYYNSFVEDIKMLRYNTQGFDDKMYSIQTATIDTNPDCPNFLVDLKTALEVNKNNSEVAKNRNKTSKKALLDNMRKTYKDYVLDDEDMRKLFKKRVTTLFSTVNGINKYKCFDEETRTFSIEDDCSAQITNSDHYYNNRDLFIVEHTNLPENDLLYRNIELSESIDFENETYKIEAKERGRLFVTNNQMYAYTSDGGVWEKTNVNSFSIPGVRYYWYGSNKTVTIQNDEEIREEIQKSCARYSGLIESYGLGDEKYEQIDTFPSILYLKAWIKEPQIELLLKSHIGYITKQYINKQYVPCLNEGLNLKDVLGVSQKTLNICKTVRLSELKDVYAIEKIVACDPSVTDEDYKEIKKESLSVDYLISLKTTYDLSIHQSLNYMMLVYNHQCLEKKTALETWYDYLRMAKLLGYNLKDKNRMFPTSLQKEHNIAMFAQRVLQEEIDRQAFKKAAEHMKVYEYSYKNLMAIAPTCPQDVIQEATSQHNCLRSYLTSMINEETSVMFVRRKDCPDESYVTVEVSNSKELVQIKGITNSNPKCKILDEFIEHWAKAKGLTFNGY